MLKAFIIALMGIFSCVAASGTSTTDDPAYIVERWLSVPTAFSQNMQGTTIQAWPKFEAQTQAVYYCFEDQKSATNLKNLVSSAINIWRPAFEHSALDIKLDPRCNNNPDCICDNLGGRINALVIYDLSAPDVPKDKNPFTTVGYDWGSQASKRHYLKFFSFDPKVAQGSKEWVDMINSLAHELGHAIGFQHEHQRADRDDWLAFHWEALQDYDKVRDRVAQVTDDPAFEPEDDGDERMALICIDFDLALKYFPICADYVQTDEIANNPIHSLWSYTFDYQSIMIYSSYDGAELGDEDDFPYYSVLEGRPPGVGQHPLLIQQGRNPADPSKFGPSAGDIARVAQLYPKGTEDGTTAMNTKTWYTKNGVVKRTEEPSTLATVTVSEQ